MRRTALVDGEGSAMRNAILMVCPVIITLMFASCQSDIIIPSIPVPFVDIEEANNFAVKERGTAVLKNRTAWMALWEQYWNVYDGQGRKTPPPGIDFNKDMVIALFYGTGYSGCSNRVDVIEKIVRTRKRIEVRIRSLLPGELGPCCALVYPLQMVKVSKSNLPVVFMGDVPE
jgi:hypothetical protein